MNSNLKTHELRNPKFYKCTTLSTFTLCDYILWEGREPLWVLVAWSSLFWLWCSGHCCIQQLRKEGFIFFFEISLDSQRETLGMEAECQMTLRFVTRSRPRSPEFPWESESELENKEEWEWLTDRFNSTFVSSMLSSLSTKISPGRIFICLNSYNKNIIFYWIGLLG